MLKEEGRKQGEKDISKTSHDVTFEQPPKLSDIGVTRKQSSRWQATASLPEEIFEKHVADTKQNKKKSLPENITKKESHYAQIVSRNPVKKHYHN